MKLKLKSGKKYSICSCGMSQSLPYCDNAHRIYNAEHGTEYKSIKMIPEEDTILEILSSNWDADK